MDGDTLFSMAAEAEQKTFAPLAVRMRPETLDDVYGQEELLGEGSFLRAMIERDTVPSLLFYGPSGVGKTTIAHVIAKATKSRFVRVNAVTAGTAELRSLIKEAKDAIDVYQKRTILFIDEIHRFNKGQQDVLLPYVEDGTVILIGATTENPYFEVNRPLLSRLRVVRLKRLSQEALISILKRALANRSKGLGYLSLHADDDILGLIAQGADSDARVALNLLEQVSLQLPEGGTMTEEIVRKTCGERLYKYDKKGDGHYDTVSAFIKSMRGSDPDAALYYLACMIEAGEQPSFIARRVVICAAEDVGLADPQALVIANAAAQAVQFVGWPEGRIPLAEAVVYIACAPKSNSAYMAIAKAQQDLKKGSGGDIPLYLRDAHYKGAAALGHGNGYLYPHDFPGGWVEQQYLPDSIKNHRYYECTDHGKEKELVAAWRKRRNQE